MDDDAAAFIFHGGSRAQNSIHQQQPLMQEINQPVLLQQRRGGGGGADMKRKEGRRKRKFANSKVEKKLLSEEPAVVVVGSPEESSAEPAAKKKKKKRRKPPSAPTPNSTVAGDDGRNPVDQDSPEEAMEPESLETSTSTRQLKCQRFIVFIGNLPYTTTTASLTAHFAKVQPTSIRHRTDKGTGKSKGFAFVEFAAYDRMKTCLQLYHHSTFDDGQSPARKINVELTAGGGGSKSKDRKSKLKAKNWKLSEERKRRAEEKAKVEKGTVAQKTDGGTKVASKASQNGDSQDMDVMRATDNGDVHPSRRSRVMGKMSALPS